MNGIQGQAAPGKDPMRSRVLRQKIGRFVGRFLAYLVLAGGAVIMVYPLLYVVLASFYTAQEFNESVLGLFPIAKEPTLDNFKMLFMVGLDTATLGYYVNSILRTLYTTAFSCLSALLGGYVFARLKFRWKEGFFLCMLATQMIPGILSVLPMYLQLRAMNLADLADQIVAEGYDLPRVDVLEYMGMTAQQANYLSVNNWIADNLVEGANKTIVYAAVPRERGTGEEFLPTYYDLIVASGGLVYNAGYDFLEAGKAYQKKILDQFPDCTPVMGWADLSMEEDYVSSVSECGKIIAGADWGYDNGSVWGAFPEYTHEEPINGEIPADYTAENGKMYVSFMMSDGDAWHFTDGSNIANFMNENRGTFPMGWSTASLFGSCNPLIMEWYYDKKSPNDEFLQGPCGISYAYASKMPARSYENFLKLTKETFGKMGITMANYWDLVNNGGGVGNSLVGSDYSLIEKYVEIVQPDLLSRGHNSLTGEWQLIGDTVVIEQIGNYWAKNGVESYGGCDNASDIVGSLEYFREHELKSDAPLFIMVNVNSWGVGVQMVPEAINELKAGENADSYEFVLPSQMVAAIRNYSK